MRPFFWENSNMVPIFRPAAVTIKIITMGICSSVRKWKGERIEKPGFFSIR